MVSTTGKSAARQQLHFNTDHQFDVWKLALESHTHSQYGKRTQSRKNKTCVVDVYFCVTDGPQPSGGLQRPLRSKPSRRLDTHCLSRILKTTYDDGSITVIYTPVHSHSISPYESIHRQQLSSTAKQAVRTMIAAGQSTPRIIRMIQGDAVSRRHRDRSDAAVHRDHFITTQDVANLRTLDLEHGVRRHLDDMFSLHLLVMELIAEPESPVLYYKPPGKFDPTYPDLPTDELLLVLATVAMLDSIVSNVPSFVFWCAPEGRGQKGVLRTTALSECGQRVHGARAHISIHHSMSDLQSRVH
jgi:hypothetical protein